MLRALRWVRVLHLVAGKVAAARRSLENDGNTKKKTFCRQLSSHNNYAVRDKKVHQYLRGSVSQ